jgi:hypothetical protein
LGGGVVRRADVSMSPWLKRISECWFAKAEVAECQRDVEVIGEFRAGGAIDRGRGLVGRAAAICGICHVLRDGGWC